MEMSEKTRVWVYQANRELSTSEVSKIEEALKGFVASWAAHEVPLKAKAEIRYQRFVVFMVDEQVCAASGCSIDKSVRIMKDLGADLGVNFYDRMHITYKQGEQIVGVSKEEFEQLIAQGKIGEDTIVFNNLVSTLHDYQNQWEVPLKNSWHAQVFEV